MRLNGSGETLSASKSPTAFVRTIADAVVAVLVAPVCATCTEPLATLRNGPVCAGCWSRVSLLTEPLCETCGDALRTWRAPDGGIRRCARCRHRPRIIAVGRAAGAYEGTLRDLLHALKYGRRRSLARPLAGLMTRTGATVLDGASFVVPVPLHFSRHYRRGFNQAAELARWIGLPVVRALRRRRATVTQTDLPEARRHRNVDGAFAVRRSARGTLHDAIVVLVDDVSTTGATLDACAATLLAAGAREVRALTAARAVSRVP